MCDDAQHAAKNPIANAHTRGLLLAIATAQMLGRAVIGQLLSALASQANRFAWALFCRSVIHERLLLLLLLMMMIGATRNRMGSSMRVVYGILSLLFVLLLLVLKV